MEQTRIPPQVGKYKVFIIDEVHMLSTQAFNAFLKTLEEPPAHVIFILATTEKHKILPTIISRCQIYDFERMTVANIIEHLKMVAQKEGITYEEEALAVIAEKADGGMRDALSIFDQAASFCQGNITYAKVVEDLNVLDSENYFNLIDYCLQNKVSEAMVLLNQVIGQGFDGGHLINGLASHVRNVLMAKDPQTIPLLEVSQQQAEKFKEQAQRCPTKFLYQALKIMNECDINYRQSSNKRLLVELTLIRVAQITQEDETPAAGRSPKRLKSLFQKLIAQSQPQTARQVAAAEKPMQRQTQATQQRQATNTPETQSPTPKPSLKLGAIGMTFSSIRKGPKAQETQEPEIANREENTQFTNEELLRQWTAMCQRMPQQMAGMAQRMRNMVPTISNFPEIEVVVDNQILLEQMNGIKGRIRATMAKALHNGNINIQLRMARGDEIKPVLTRRELFDKMRQNNKAIDKMCQLLNMELA
jgi:DNA polymerase-3 subunit gamma/tau